MLSMFLKQTKTNLMLTMQSYSIKTLALKTSTHTQNPPQTKTGSSYGDGDWQPHPRVSSESTR